MSEGRGDGPAEVLRVPAHPVALLEPGLQLVVGAVLLGWLQSGPTGVVLGWALIVAGFVFVVRGLRPIWSGPIRVEGDRVSLFGGPMNLTEDTVCRDDIASITVHRGAGRLKYDPVHLVLGLFVNFGSLEIQTRSGDRLRAGPVGMNCLPHLTAWLAGGGPLDPTHGPAGRSAQPDRGIYHPAVVLALVLSIAITLGLAGVATTAGPATFSLLIASAAAMEVMFWIGVFSTARRESPLR